jgi:hypothetical protein
MRKSVAARSLRTIRSKVGPCGRVTPILGVMGFEETLDRVQRDLQRGHTFVAVQRLVCLVQLHPTDLELRGRLAAVHLSTGNWVEAGRWSYLGEARDDKAKTAFEHAFRHPRARLEALRWPSTADEAVPPTAAARLQELQVEASRLPRRERHGKFLTAPRKRTPDALRTTGVVVVWAASIAIYVLGMVALVRWIIETT